MAENRSKDKVEQQIEFQNKVVEQVFFDDLPILMQDPRGVEEGFHGTGGVGTAIDPLQQSGSEVRHHTKFPTYDIDLNSGCLTDGALMRVRYTIPVRVDPLDTAKDRSVVRPVIEPVTISSASPRLLTISNNPCSAGGIVFDFVPAQLRTGKIIYVDAVYGNDATAQRESPFAPFATIGAALLAALPGDLIYVRPGTYNLTAGITIPNGVTIRGASRCAVTIQMLNVTVATTLITMGENSCIENVSLKLTSAQHVALTGIKFGGTTSATAKVSNVALTLNNSSAGVGTSNVIGILVQSTGLPSRDTIAVDKSLVSVKSSGTGIKRACLLNTSAGNIFLSDTSFVCSGVAGTDFIGVETNIAGGLLGIYGGTIDGAIADISQTAGTIELAGTNLVHANANGKTFTAHPSFMQVWADSGALPAGVTLFYRPGTATITMQEIKITMPRKAVVQRLHVRLQAAPGVGRTDRWIVRKNGVDTSLAVSIADTNTVGSNTSASVSFAAGDQLSLKVVTAVATSSADSLCSVEIY